MKKFVIMFLVVFSFPVLAGFVHPMDFNGSETQKNEVIQFIKDRVKQDYCGAIDMCDNLTLRMMEQQNLEAFKQATRARNREIMDRVIRDYCFSGLDMCDYITIKMMYEQNEHASNQDLTW